jgi:hypothetical protein
MKKIIKTISVSFFLLVTASTLHAQNFPATEKEAKDILCTGKWTVDSLGRSGKMKEAAEVKMDGTILTFKEDGTYTITVFGKDKPGKWVLVLADKKVNMYEKKEEPDSVIMSMSSGQLVMGRGDGSDLKMTWKKAE